MTRYEIVGDEVELYFDDKPSYETRAEMKALRIWWNPDKMCWHGKHNSNVLALAKRLCGLPAKKNKSKCKCEMLLPGIGCKLPFRR